MMTPAATIVVISQRHGMRTVELMTRDTITHTVMHVSGVQSMSVVTCVSHAQTDGDVEG